ncbi:MAG: amino acid permease, partial [Rubrobacter sp.]
MSDGRTASEEVPADLGRFGYEETLKRDFDLWSIFALAFAFISPIVALYAIFGLAFAAGGPAFWWGFLVVLGGQALVALVFAELVSRWPIEGSVYQWSRRLVGNGYGWFAGWAYMWTLVIAMAAVAYGAAGFLAPLVGVQNPGNGTLVLLSLGVVVFATFINTVARAVLKIMVGLSIVAEFVASLAIGTILLLFYRENPISVIFSSSGTAGGAFDLAGFIVAVSFIGWSFVGFESAGAVAEEVRDAERNVPRAMLLSLVIVAAVAMYAGLALILAIPNIGAVVAGNVADPITNTLAAKLGSGITTPLFAMIVVGFVASFLALQTS